MWFVFRSMLGRVARNLLHCRQLATSPQCQQHSAEFYFCVPLPQSSSSSYASGSVGYALRRGGQKGRSLQLNDRRSWPLRGVAGWALPSAAVSCSCRGRPV